MRKTLFCIFISLAAFVFANDIVPQQFRGCDFPDMEIAMTPEECQRGLMFRKEIPETGGMLFVFAEERERHFWMKNTLVPLDIIFLDGQGRVVSVFQMPSEPPRRPGESEEAYESRLPSYASQNPARYAIELRAGMASYLQIQPGDVLELNLPADKTAR
jgi:hypothetical protein